MIKLITVKRIDFYLDSKFDSKHVTNGMNAKKVYDRGKLRCDNDSRISCNTLISNTSIISEYLTKNFDKLEVYENNSKFKFTINTSSSEAMTYFKSGGEVKCCSKVTVVGNINEQNSDYIITHLSYSELTEDIKYSDKIKSDLEEKAKKEAMSDSSQTKKSAHEINKEKKKAQEAQRKARRANDKLQDRFKH